MTVNKRKRHALSDRAWRLLASIRDDQDGAQGVPPRAVDILGGSVALWDSLHFLVERHFVVSRGVQVGITRAGRHALAHHR
jgi:hypothetical protein